MSQKYHYAIIGAGRQGTATAYDLAKWGDAASVLLADVNAGAAAVAAARVNSLIGGEIATSTQVDVRDVDALIDILRPIDVFVCGTPFVYIMNCTQAAIEAGAGMVDFGGHTDTVLRQLELFEEAESKGIAIVPDCGMGPGMNNTMGVYTVEQLSAHGIQPREVRLWDGGLPQNPPEPWGYQIFFHINGLTNEYDSQAVFLRDGTVTLVDTFTEVDILEFDGVGTLEAFVTSGGTSTVPYNYEGFLQVYENKTCRYPGHYAQFKAFKDLGLFSEEPVEINGAQVKPRDVFHTLLAPQLQAEQSVDVCVMRAKGTGDKDGQRFSLVVDLIDYYDEATGFTAMERLTGWHAGIMAEFIARGAIPKGTWSLEKAITATRFLEKARERGFTITEYWEPVAPNS